MDEFKLCTALYGHSLDVRSLGIASNNSIISGSRDKTARLWRNTGFDTSYTEAMTYRDQTNFVACVLYLEPTASYPEGLVLTGGNDNKILVYKPLEPFAASTLHEHSNVVCCLSKGKEPNSFVSGSWDTTAKFWILGESQSSHCTFRGHASAVWSVLQRNDGLIVTASADKSIRIWNKDGQQVKVLEGHTDCVRGLEDFPELNCFISISNDATIRAWSYLGDALNTYYGHTNYIYDISRCRAGGENCFVTSDEDYTVRYWHNGVNTQVIKLPAQSVWCVACLQNGDIVTGSSDGVVRIFTRDPERVADQAALAKYEEEVKAVLQQSTQEIGGVKVTDLPGKEALYDPGKKAGQMKMIREPHGVVAYTWVESGSDSHWEKVGDVLGGTDKDATGKTTYEGKSYDFVFSVDVEDGKPPIKLPYNKGDDPYVAAYNFLEKNMLPASYLDQIVDFILKNSKTELPPMNSNYVDPFTGASRYTPSSTTGTQNSMGLNADPFTGANSYSTGNHKTSSNVSYSSIGGSFFPMTEYRTFEMGDPNVILTKLIEFNKKCGDGNETIAESSLHEVIKICSGPPTDPNVFDVLFKMLEWPDDVIFPVLDVVRLAVRHKKNNQVLSSVNNGVLLQKLRGYVSENCKIVNNLIVALRTLVNLFVHEEGERLVLENRFDIFESVTSLGSLNKSAEVALATLLLNMTIGVIKQKDELGISVLAEVIPDILSKLKDPESQFRGYVALGTLFSTPVPGQVQEVKVKIKENGSFICKLEQHVLSGSNDLETKRMTCARQIQDIVNS